MADTSGEVAENMLIVNKISTTCQIYFKKDILCKDGLKNYNVHVTNLHRDFDRRRKPYYIK